MAAIDKIYGDINQQEELYNWLANNRPDAIKYLYPVPDGYGPVSNFPQDVDVWLYNNCPLDWVIEAIVAQYGEERIEELSK